MNSLAVTERDRRYAIAVGCPICYAEPGDSCVSEDGERIVPVHGSRITDLRELADHGVRAYADAKIKP